MAAGSGISATGMCFNTAWWSSNSPSDEQDNEVDNADTISIISSTLTDSMSTSEARDGDVSKPVLINAKFLLVLWYH